jgi:hypothetical protein
LATPLPAPPPVAEVEPPDAEDALPPEDELDEEDDDEDDELDDDDEDDEDEEDDDDEDEDDADDAAAELDELAAVAAAGTGAGALLPVVASSSVASSAVTSAAVSGQSLPATPVTTAKPKNALTRKSANAAPDAKSGCIRREMLTPALPVLLGRFRAALKIAGFMGGKTLMVVLLFLPALSAPVLTGAQIARRLVIGNSCLGHVL